MNLRHLGLLLVVTLVACSSPRQPAPSAEPTPLDLFLAARRGFVSDGELLTNDQPQWRAVVSPGGSFTFSAQRLAAHPAPATLSLRLASLQRGGTLQRAAVPGRVVRDGKVDLDWGAVTERLETREGHLEHSFLFDAEPAGSGPFELTLSADGFETAAVGSDGVHFRVAASPIGVRYGHGVWVDARGLRTPVPVRLEGRSLRLSVPAEVLAGSSYPAVLDPALDPELDFPDGGTLVPAPRAQRSPAVGTGTTGWLVVWEDQRHLLYRGTDLYASRVAFDGGLLDPAGIPLSVAPGDQLDPRVTFNGEQYVVTWSDARAGLHPYAVFVNESGQVGQELKLTNAGGDQHAVRAASNGALTLIVWEQVNLVGLRLLNDGGVLDPNGMVLSGWPNAAAHDLAWNGEAFVHVHEGDGPVAMFFELDGGTRTFPLSDGGTTTQLGLTSSTNNALYGRTISLTSLGDGRVAALWVRSNNGQWPADLRASVIASDGGNVESILFNLPWFDARQVRASFDGTKVVGCATGSFNQVPPEHALTVSLKLDGGIGPVVVLTADAGNPSGDCAVGSGPGVVLAAYRSRTEFEPSIRVQLLAGDFTQAAPERVLSTAKNPQELPAVAQGGFTSLPWLIAWSDARSAYSGFDVYGQRLGNPGGSPPGTPFLISARPADEVGVRLLSVKDAGYVATWSEGSPFDSSTPSPPRAMRISAGGVLGPVLDLPSSFLNHQTPVAALEGRTVVLAGGYNEYGGNNVFETWSFGLDFDGGITRSAHTITTSRNQLRLAPRGNALLAAWDNGDLQGRFLVDGGTGSQAAFTLVSAAGSQTNVALAPLGDTTLIAWEDWRSGVPQVRATYFLPDGGGIGAGVGFVVSTQPGAQRFPVAQALDDGRVVIAWEQQTDAGIDVFATFLSAQGTSLDPTGQPWAGDGGATQNLRPQLATDGVGRAVLTWNRLSEDGTRLSAVWRRVNLGVPQGAACASSSDCSEGACVDGRCCNSPCGGNDPGDCQACSVATGASADGICTVLSATFICRPARDLTCDVEEVCEGAPDCPFDVVQNEGLSCGAGGTCTSGACAVDGGVDSGVGGGGGATGGGGGATGGGGGAIAMVTEVEPNDTKNQVDVNGQALTGTSRVSGSLAASEADLFKLTLGANMVLRLELKSPTACSAIAGVKLALLSSTGTELAVDTSAPCPMLVSYVPAGTYYLAVARTATGTAFTYTLDVTFPSNRGAETEPNENTFGASLLGGADVFLSGAVNASTDVDMFEFTVAQPSTVRAEIIEGAATTCESNGVDSMLDLLSGAGLVIIGDDDSGRGYCSRIDGLTDGLASNLPAGTYFLRVTHSTSGTFAAFQYRLVVKVTAP